MNYELRIEQSKGGKIGVYSGPKNVMLTLSQIEGMGIDVYQLDDFDVELFRKAYHLEDAANTGIPVRSPKRADFFRMLLEEYNAQPQTPLREATVRLLQELQDELPKNWISYAHRPPQKFIGSINVTYGNAEKIIFETSGGEYLWEVAHNPELREFVMHGWDIGRHRRYDYDIDTSLVALVSGTQLVGLEWLVPWKEDTPWVWQLENAETLRCSCVIHGGDRIYAFVQATPCTDETGALRYRYAEVFLSLRRYAPETIANLLQEHGRCVSDFRIARGDDIDWCRIADLIAQSELMEPKNMEKPLLTFEEVRKKITKDTKLDLSACQPAARVQEEA